MGACAQSPLVEDTAYLSTASYQNFPNSIGCLEGGSPQVNSPSCAYDLFLLQSSAACHGTDSDIGLRPHAHQIVGRVPLEYSSCASSYGARPTTNFLSQSEMSLQKIYPAWNSNSKSSYNSNCSLNFSNISRYGTRSPQVFSSLATIKRARDELFSAGRFYDSSVSFMICFWVSSIHFLNSWLSGRLANVHALQVDTNILEDSIENRSSLVRHEKQLPLVVSTASTNGSSGVAKTRIRWTQELHERFVESVNQLGGAESKDVSSLLRLLLLLALFFSFCLTICTCSTCLIQKQLQKES